MIQVRHLDVGYSRHNPVLKDVNFHLNSGQCMALLGNNGAGKSTLLKSLNRILVPQGGTIRLGGTDVASLTRRQIAQQIAYVAQRCEPLHLTVYDTILLGRRPWIFFKPEKNDFRVVQEVLCSLELQDMAHRYLDELSGGEQQKVMLARALAQQPKVLLLDEPTSNLDLKNQCEILDLVREMVSQEKLCVVLVLHDLNQALRCCDRFLLLTPSGNSRHPGRSEHRHSRNGEAHLRPFCDSSPLGWKACHCPLQEGPLCVEPCKTP